MNDDNYGTMLLEPLRGEPSGPPSIDVAKAMRDGRRMRRRWWAGGSGLLAAVAAVLVGGSLLLAPSGHDAPKPQPKLPPDPAVPASCVQQRLPMGKYHNIAVRGGDAAGRWHVGSGDPAPGKKSPVLIWRDGKLIAATPTPSELYLYDINSAGMAVGSNQTGLKYPYAYRDGNFIKLKGGVGEATAINDDGTIVGVLGRAGLDGGAVPVRWTSIDAEPERLPLPGGTARFFMVYDLAEDGTVMAQFTEQMGALRGEVGYVWMPDGSLKRVLPPAAAGRMMTFQPIGLHYGWLYGEADSWSTIQASPTNSAGVPQVREPGSMQTGYETSLYRFEPHSGTWQKLEDTAQVAVSAPGARQQGMEPAPTVYVGPKVLKLPTDAKPSIGAGFGFHLVTISEDGRTVAGTALSVVADPILARIPVIWRCE
ncbi:hypothetical protein [Actinoplanes sp. NPDC026619]|uniref:hypothetical protein n=1 Tax=Actinoplanes sp. NPDC026619 TaxID=3155798 RepID=UPI0033C9A615